MKIYIFFIYTLMHFTATNKKIILLLVENPYWWKTVGSTYDLGSIYEASFKSNIFCITSDIYMIHV
uniref:Uncharacterized protein n=1 Tax=Nelumbo nucifera TaxID=4432 RepID=A0A822ZDC9_NELNU|nr:TPA_asm: hypothetical protein HUJ06_016014 [Nelumbo nucifera]